MASLLQRARSIWKLSPLREFHSETARYFSHDKAVEVETLPDYEPEEFYPVYVGEVFNQKY
jgi:hypothetical protein